MPPEEMDVTGGSMSSTYRPSRKNYDLHADMRRWELEALKARKGMGWEVERTSAVRTAVTHATRTTVRVPSEPPAPSMTWAPAVIGTSVVAGVPAFLFMEVLLARRSPVLMLIGLIAAVVIGTAAVYVGRTVSDIRKRKRAIDTPAKREAELTAQRTADTLTEARDIHAAVEKAWHGFLFAADPETGTVTADSLADTYLNRPLLNSASEPKTQEFMSAMERVESARDRATDKGGEKAAREYLTAARKLREAWSAADDNARRKSVRGIGPSGERFNDGERKNLEQARSLILQALDDSMTAEFSRNALNKASELIIGAGFPEAAKLPQRAVLAIPADRRPALGEAGTA